MATTAVDDAHTHSKVLNNNGEENQNASQSSHEVGPSTRNVNDVNDSASWVKTNNNFDDGASSFSSPPSTTSQSAPPPPSPSPSPPLPLPPPSYSPQIQQQQKRKKSITKKSILLRTMLPPLLTSLITFLTYWDPDALHGCKFVYDDLGSVQKNVIVNGEQPWTQVFRRDFWGTPLSDPNSHKSFRPVTTLSFRWNYVHNEKRRKVGTADEAFGYRVVNLGLHVAVVALVTVASRFVFDDDDDNDGWKDTAACVATGLLFGLHPVHVEAVSNVTSRGELLMSLFFLLAFVSYASYAPSARRRRARTRRLMPTNNYNKSKDKQEEDYGYDRDDDDIPTTGRKCRQIIGLYVAPFLFFVLSLFSKEQGGTTLISLAAYDFFENVGSIQDLAAVLLPSFKKKKKKTTTTTTTTTTMNKEEDQEMERKRKDMLGFIRRTMVLAIQTITVCAFRLRLNGESKPDFIYDQNPAAFSEDAFTRIMSVNWVYCLYLFDAIFPEYLSCDWSGESISLIEHVTDVRIFLVVDLWLLVLFCCRAVIVAPRRSAHYSGRGQTRRIALLAVFAFLLSPFLLSSNLLVKVGLMKGDRVIYLPLLGFCILESLLLKVLFFGGHEEENHDCKGKNGKERKKSSTSMLGMHWIGHILLLTQLTLFAAKTRERNLAWSNSLRLWTSAYEVNPYSRHTRYNCGYELALDGQFERAEEVLRPIGRVDGDSPATTFVYTMVLKNLNRCDEARPIVEEALEVVRRDTRKRPEEISSSSPKERNRVSSMTRTESNLMVVKALCTENLAEIGKIMYRAVEIDPGNEYAVSQAQNLMEKVQELNLLQKQQLFNPQYSKSSRDMKSKDMRWQHGAY